MVGFLDKHLTKQDKKEIIAAIIQAEKMTSGEIRVHLQKKCKEDVFWEAKKVFHRLRIHKTKHRNGVLIFVALESRKFAILGDSGIHHHVGDSYWSQARDKMASYFMKGQMKEGIVAGVLGIGEKLRMHFPTNVHSKNEISNQISEE